VIEPGNYDITIHQGATFKLDLQYKDGDGDSVDMTGYTVASKLYDRLGDDLLASFVHSWIVQESGSFRLSLSSSTTSGITEDGQYDVLITEPGGDKYYILQGQAFLDRGLTGR
jgi:hypothetical protein